MYRKDGPIPPIEKNRIPKRFIVFDSEAYRLGFDSGVEVQSLRLGVACYVKLDKSCKPLEYIWLDFQDLGGLLSFIEDKTRKDNTLYIYAHNLKYDLQLTGLLTGLIGRGWGSSLFVAEDPPTFIRLKRGRMTIMLVDTFNYWQFSLAKMGEQLGLAKLPMPLEGANNKEWFTYCKRDVEVLTRYLLSFMFFLIENDLAPLGLTLASQAFRAYRHKFMSHEIIIHNDQRALILEREGYSGGRVEAFFIGEVKDRELYKLDVNSMYSYVMNDNVYPVRLYSYSENIPLTRLEHLLNTYYVIARVQLTTLEPVYPYKLNGKLVFPVGSFETVLHHSELAHGLKNDHIQAIKGVAIYDRQPIFQDYVAYFYALKCQAEENHNPILRFQAKLFLNSLYGKFGQREVISEIQDNPGPVEYKRLTGFSEALNRTVEINYLGNKIEIRYTGNESQYSFPGIAGAVTANARVYLWHLITIAGPGEVLYCDTDSLVVTRLGLDRLEPYLDPVRLGALKIEGNSSMFKCLGPKDYIFGEEIKHKGIPKQAVTMGPNLFSYEQFRGFKTWLKQGLPPGVEVYQRTKERKAIYDKGVVTPTGRVIPLMFNGR